MIPPAGRACVPLLTFAAVVALTALLMLPLRAVAAEGPQPTVSPLPPSDYAVRPACAAPAPGSAGCLALELVPETPGARAHTHPLGMARRQAAGGAKATALCEPPTAAAGCYGLRPQDLRKAYALPSAAPSQQTIALVEAYGDPTAESDLRVYDEAFGLSACTVANGCLTIVNGHGEASPLPGKQAGWALETSLDIETAHGVCENCRILLVEASGESYVALDAAEQTAADLGASEISNSWGGEAPSLDSAAFNHPGTIVTAATGDFGYLNWNATTFEAKGKVGYPASSPNVVAVGGTRLSVTPEGAWAGETVWNGGNSTLVVSRGSGGSGCSPLYAAPPWQLGLPDWTTVGCGSMRAASDVAADADPYTGVAVYDSTTQQSYELPPGWLTLGGTSVASPLIAATFALAGGADGVSYPARTLYEGEAKQPSSLHDVVSGSNGECSTYAPEGLSGCSVAEEAASCSAKAICVAGPGYDGPSGVGTPDGLGAFEYETATGPVRKAQTIEITSARPSSASVGGPGYAASAKASSGLAVTFSSATPTVCSLEGTNVTLAGAGTCTIEAGQAGDKSYAPAPEVQQSFSVGRGSQRLEFTSAAPTAATVGGPVYTVAAAATSGLIAAFSSGTPAVCSVEGERVTPTATGTCTVDANQAGNSNYLAAPEARQSFVVGKGAQLIRFASTPPTAATFGGLAYAVSATATSGLAVSLTSDTPSVCTLSSGQVSFGGVGTCTIQAGQDGSANYDAAAVVTQSFAVSPAPQTITFTSTPPPAPTVGSVVGYTVAARASSGLAVSLVSGTPFVCTLVGSQVTLVAAGTCTIEASQEGSADYAAAPAAWQSFAVSRRSQTIRFTSDPPATEAVGGAQYVVAASASSGLAVTLASGTPSVCSLQGPAVSFLAAGTCTLDAIQPGDSEFSPASRAQLSFVVGRGSQQITFTSPAPTGAIAGGAEYVVTATSSAGLVVTLSSGTPSVCSLIGTDVLFREGGTCVIDANQAGDANFAPAPTTTLEFGVDANLLLTAGPGSGFGSGAGRASAEQGGSATPIAALSLLRGPAVDRRSGAVTIDASVSVPGHLEWLITFRNGTFGAFSATSCPTGQIHLDGTCRPSNVVFGRGGEQLSKAGSVRFTVSPGRSARTALTRARGQARGLPIVVELTFIPAGGGRAITHVSAVAIKLDKSRGGAGA